MSVPFLDLLRSQSSVPILSLARVLDSPDPSVFRFPCPEAPNGIARLPLDDADTILRDHPIDPTFQSFRYRRNLAFAVRSGELIFFPVDDRPIALFSNVSDAKWSNYNDTYLIVLFTNGDLLIYDTETGKIALPQLQSSDDFFQTHIAPGPSQLPWAKYGVLIASKTSQLCFLQPFMPRNFVIPSSDRRALAETIPDSRDLFDALFDHAGRSRGLFGRGLDSRRFIIDVQIPGQIVAIEWRDAKIFVLTNTWELHTLELKRVPTFVDESAHIGVGSIGARTFSSTVALCANVWGVFVVGNSEAWPIEQAGVESVRRQRLPVTDAGIAHRIQELEKRGQDLREREARVRAQIIEVMGRLTAVKADDLELLRELLKKTKTLNERLRSHESGTPVAVRGYRFSLEADRTVQSMCG
jgi:hypothetical protein